MRDNQKLLSLAIEVAKDVSKILLKDVEGMRHVKKNLSKDVKIEADYASEDFIVGKLSQETEYPILSEESEEKYNVSDVKCRRWIVDPLDGSFNFLRGIPLYCISIALWDDMEPLLGVVYDFNRAELFYGIVGEGAWLNNVPIRVSSTREISGAVLCTGFPVSFDLTKANLDGFIDSVKEFKKVRMIGSAALSLSYVACGRVDFYQEKAIKIWDVAAGLAIVKAAGGKIENKHSLITNVFNVKAANEFLFNNVELPLLNRTRF